MDHTNILPPGKKSCLLITGEGDMDSAVTKCFENPALEILVLKDGSRGSRLYRRSSSEASEASSDRLQMSPGRSMRIR